jgi:hypothetical protein
MGFGAGLILTAVGAILAWAVTASANGVNIHAVGYILLVVGIVGMLMSLVFWSSWAGPGYFTRSHPSTTTPCAGGGAGSSTRTSPSPRWRAAHVV